MPRWRNCGRFITTPDQVKFADLINAVYFQSHICHPNARPFDMIPDPELVGVVSFGTNGDSKIAMLSTAAPVIRNM